MSPEKRPQPLLDHAKDALFFLSLPLWAFSYRSRREIGIRDDWHCRNCSRGFKDRDGGFMVDAAHYDHRKNWKYDKPKNGRILCRMCHMKEHLDDGDLTAARLLASSTVRNGLHKTEMHERDRGLLARDIDLMVNTISAWGYNPDDIVPIPVARR